MAPKTPWKITFDVETDWGGRSHHTQGVVEGLPVILGLLKKYDKKALFFVSTELLRDYRSSIEQIRLQGHELGSHGHFHFIYDHPHRFLHDYEISQTILSAISLKNYHQFRAPKFNVTLPNHPYSDKRNHWGLLKGVWFNRRINPENILYAHPFDIVNPKTKAPNLFCTIWYSRHKEALKKLEDLLSKSA